jgi:hypothetical protein
VKAEALSRLAKRRPDLWEEVATIAELRPFYDLTRDRHPTCLPYAPVDAEGRLSTVIRAIERLASE